MGTCGPTSDIAVSAVGICGPTSGMTVSEVGTCGPTSGMAVSAVGTGRPAKEVFHFGNGWTPSTYRYLPISLIHVVLLVSRYHCLGCGHCRTPAVNGSHT